jgi:hypothetical protein
MADSEWSVCIPQLFRLINWFHRGSGCRLLGWNQLRLQTSPMESLALLSVCSWIFFEERTNVAILLPPSRKAIISRYSPRSLWTTYRCIAIIHLRNDGQKFVKRTNRMPALPSSVFWLTSLQVPRCRFPPLKSRHCTQKTHSLQMNVY